ncbi:LuxR C-terminal-related transcriptional regulator [Nostoc sp. CENA543]|uniref:LuxR C-terminal-related transcriptional regulator n=1 Tax=Nostoc sp. CENA543 TaxID=1869241 RepID=UPI0012FFF4F7
MGLLEGRTIRLTKREAQILELLAEPYNREWICQHLQISRRTLENHIYMQRLTSF